AMLAAFADPKLRGRVFSFNNAMDHAGAVIGPLAASAFLYFAPDSFRALFTLPLIPGAIVILILLRVPDPDRPAHAPGRSSAWFATRTEASRAAASMPRAFYAAMCVILLFSLGNASDAFLLLRLSDLGVAPVWIPLLWSALHVVKVTSSVVGGELSDRFGRR